MTEKELVRRRLQAQYLTGTSTAADVSSGLCGIQSQYAANALHALKIRCRTVDLNGLVKAWTLRGTLHLFPSADLPLYLERGREDPFDTAYGRWRFAHGCGVSRQRMQFFCRVIEERLSHVPVSRDELKHLCRQQGMTQEEEPWVFDGWGGAVRLLAEDGRLCVSASPARHYVAAPALAPVEREEARRELLRRYLLHYGPATLRDAAYFFRWPQREIRTVMAALPVETKDCKGVQHYCLQPSDQLPAMPRCRFLAGFDPMLLGYEKTENPILPAAYVKKIFNNTGIVFPALLVDGVVRGKWKEQPGRTDITLFEPLSERQKQFVLKEADRLWPGKSVRWL